MSGTDIGARAAYAIGLDVGGTKIAAGVVSGQGKLLERVARPTTAVRHRGPTLSLTLQLVNESDASTRA